MGRKRTEIISPEREKVLELLQTSRDPRQRERLLAARMAMTGEFTLAMIAQATGRARSAIQRWLDRFEEGGVEALLERKSPPGRPAKLSAEMQEQTREGLRKGLWRTAEQFRRHLQEQHGLELSKAGTYYWLGRLDGESAPSLSPTKARSRRSARPTSTTKPK